MIDLHEASYSIEEIEACSDLETLRAWFELNDRREVHIRSFINAFKEAAVDDEDWFRRTAGALAYCSIGRKFIERRILTLGGTPPYSPTDPRAKELRHLNARVTELQKRNEELEREAARSHG